MTETTTAATKAKTTKDAASSYGLPDYGIPKFDLPNMEMPKAFREMAEQGVAHAKDTYAQASVASDQAVDLLQNTYATVAQGVTDYNLKLFEIAGTNTHAAFDCAHELSPGRLPRWRSLRPATIQRARPLRDVVTSCRHAK